MNKLGSNLEIILLQAPNITIMCAAKIKNTDNCIFIKKFEVLLPNLKVNINSKGIVLRIKSSLIARSGMPLPFSTTNVTKDKMDIIINSPFNRSAFSITGKLWIETSAPKQYQKTAAEAKPGISG